MGEADNLLKENIYQAVIVDLRLTGVHGEEGLEIIKYVKELHPQTNVILVTGLAVPQSWKKLRLWERLFTLKNLFPVRF